MGALRTRDQLEDEIIASYSPIPDSLCALIEEESWAELRAVSLRHSTSLLVLLSLGLILPLVAAGLGMRGITGPIVALTRAARRMADGDVHQQVVVPGEDEVGALAEAFNRMSTELRGLYLDLERRVEARTRELSAINAIASVVSRSLDLGEILNAALGKVLEVTGMHAGTCYRLNSATGELRLIAAIGLSDVAIRDVMRVPLVALIERPDVMTAPLARLIDEFPRGPFRELLKAEG